MNSETEEKPPVVLEEAKDKSSEVANVEIVADGTIFMLKMPVTIGKMGAYGALEMMRDEVAKFYYVMAKQAAEEKQRQAAATRLHIPGRSH